MKDPVYPEFRLDQWSSMRLQLLWAYQKEMEMPNKLHHSTYHFQTAALVKQGWAEAGTSEATMIRAKAGQWLIFHQGERWQRFSQNCQLLSIGYRFQLPSGEAIFDEGLPIAINASTYPALEKSAKTVLKRMKQHIGTGFMMLKQVVDMQHYLLSQNALRSFLIELAAMCHAEQISSRSMRHGNAHIIRALELIQSSPSSVEGKPIKIGDIASEIGLHPTYLDRLMVTETGLSVFKHINKRRLQMAQDALIADQDNLKTISYALGFSSPAHFNSWFKKKEGCSPMQYKRRTLYP